MSIFGIFNELSITQKNAIILVNFSLISADTNKPNKVIQQKLLLQNIKELNVDVQSIGEHSNKVGVKNAVGVLTSMTEIQKGFLAILCYELISSNGSPTELEMKTLILNFNFMNIDEDGFIKLYRDCQFLYNKFK